MEQTLDELRSENARLRRQLETYKHVVRLLEDVITGHMTKWALRRALNRVG